MTTKKRQSHAGGKSQVSADSLPLYCDFSCPHAEFPPADAVGACRREQAVWCGMEKKYNVKNGKCLKSNK